MEKVDKNDTYKFTSVAWDESGETIFAGCSDGIIRVFKIGVKQN